MNQDVINFLVRNNIDADSIKSLSDSHIYEPKEVNSVISSNSFHMSPSPMKISIADIVGYETEWRGFSNNFLDSMGCLFDSNGDGYHSRSIGLLDYSTEEIIEEMEDISDNEFRGLLRRSFINDPICVQEVDKGKYTISENGLHRFNMLKMHYLKELSKLGNDPEKIEELNSKFTIPVMASKLDYTKTYCKALLGLSSPLTKVEYELDEYYTPTDRVSIIDEAGCKLTLNNEELIEYVKLKLYDFIDDEFFREKITYYSSKYDSFKEFIDYNIPTLKAINSNKGEGAK